MPWVAIPFEEKRSIKSNLATMFAIRGIPTFIVLNGIDGTVKDNQGRATVSSSKGNITQVLKQWKETVGTIPKGADGGGWGCSLM